MAVAYAFVVLFYFLSITQFYCISAGSLYDYVTCGSALKLLNVHHAVRLHSHEVKYGQGSGQQSVTGVTTEDDHNSYWQVREPHNKQKNIDNCARGEPIKCGQMIRLTHLSTQRNLHTHHFASPLSHNQEVSAFGENGEGDEGDNWIVQCETELWRREGIISFKHVSTNAYLMVSEERYGRPIAGQAEVCSTHLTHNRGTTWRAAEGVYVKPNAADAPGNKYSSDDDEEDIESVKTGFKHDESEL
jgi:dolichyl-phosphate-mannose--protein O-mannosyl transferase